MNAIIKTETPADRSAPDLRQISDKVFAEAFLFDLDIATPLLPSPYAEFPFLVIEGFMDELSCKAIVDAAKKAKNAKHAALLSRRKKLNQKIRKTKILTLSPAHKKLYTQAFNRARPEIEHFFSLSLTTSTDVQVLEYTPGSFYKAHADDSSMLVDLDDGKVVGFKQVSPQRKVSSVLFASEQSETVHTPYQFSGGELIYNYFKDEEGNTVMFRPKMGTLIVFASNPIYTHEVKTVTEGYRLTLVQWHDALL